MISLLQKKRCKLANLYTGHTKPLSHMSHFVRATWHSGPVWSSLTTVRITAITSKIASTVPQIIVI
jgi:hypothetical protein